MFSESDNYTLPLKNIDTEVSIAVFAKIVTTARFSVKSKNI